MNTVFFKKTFLLIVGFAVLLTVATPGTKVVFSTQHDEDLEEDQAKNQTDAFKILNDMEIRAEKARDLFWKGRYQEATKIFEQLSATSHPSQILYLNELGYSHLVSGDYENAERSFRKAYSLLETYRDLTLEKKALSSFGKESEKIYRGDPYEQTTSYLLLAVLLINKGDYDNALAMLKAAAMADSDTTENLYESDFTLIHLLESKIYQMEEDGVNFDICRELAVRSYRTTHPNLRDKFSERLDQLALLKMPPGERKKVGVVDTDDIIKKKIRDLSEEIHEKSNSINAAQELGPIYSCKYNTLILVPRGKSPYKLRKGKDAQLVFFKTVDLKTQRPLIVIDEKAISYPPVPQVGDLEFQATTRGGRRMDAILKGKAAYRATTVGVGEIVTQIGDNVGGMIGLGLLMIGVATQAAGGAMTPEGDTRAWKTLPRQFEVYALNLPRGEHNIEFEQHVYFEVKDRFKKTINISGPDVLKVVVAPPSLAGIYSQQMEETMKLSKRDTRDKDDPSLRIAITPPLGLKRIERFRSPDRKIEAEAFAPDARRVMRKIKKKLKKGKISSYLVRHRDIIDSGNEQMPKSHVAFQLALEEIGLQKSGKEKIYHATYNMSLVDISTGEILYSKVIRGTHSPKKDDATKGFYGSLDNALSQFVSGPEFNQALNRSTKKTARL